MDALGGLIGRNTDRAHLHTGLNIKGRPFGHYAQTDKHLYQQFMQNYLEQQPLITIRQGEVIALDRVKTIGD